MNVAEMKKRQKRIIEWVSANFVELRQYRVQWSTARIQVGSGSGGRAGLAINCKAGEANVSCFVWT